jgi:RNA-directed DNA polymerase
MRLATPELIRTLQRKLYVKAKLEPAYRFYALYDKVYRADILSHAWLLVKANRGSPGIDGVNFEAIESGEGVDSYLRQISFEYAKLPGEPGETSDDSQAARHRW